MNRSGKSFAVNRKQAQNTIPKKYCNLAYIIANSWNLDISIFTQKCAKVE